MSSDLANRIRKRQRHLRKWARRTGVTCYRVYDRDLPDQPLIVEWFEGDAVVWLLDRRRDETPEQDREWCDAALAAVHDALEIDDVQLYVKRRRRQKGRHEGRGQYERVARGGVTKVVTDVVPKVEINLTDYLDTGLFLDHRLTRLRVGKQAAGKRVLNLFAYTGAFTVHAALGGAASTMSVDLSRTYCEWTQRNLRLNGIATGGPHRIVRMDVRAFLAEAQRRRDRWDLIVCDPPTFSVSKRTEETFDVQRDHVDLLHDCARALDEGGQLLFSTNRRSFQLDRDALAGLGAWIGPHSLEEITRATTDEDFARRPAHSCWSLARLPPG